MDRQERRQQAKQKERQEKNRAEQAYEETAQQRRLPVHPVWFVVGTALVLAAVYVWTFGIW
jgi:hypothetical protein